MKPEWREYLVSIGMQDAFLQRAEEVIAKYFIICPEEIQDIFVNDHLDANGNRNYSSLYLFSRSFAMEAKNFLRTSDFDLAGFRNAIVYIEIHQTEYEFLKATEKSRLRIVFRLSSGIVGEFNASQENCDRLFDIYLRIVIPNAVAD